MTTDNKPLDPNDYERVSAGCQCPQCGEDDIDQLVWIDDNRVRCNHCGTVYNPRWRKTDALGNEPNQTTPLPTRPPGGVSSRW